MTLNSALFFLYARTSVHVGSGRGAGSIDLPIMRQKSSGLPIIPSTSIKGVWRDAAPSWKLSCDKVTLLFGSADESDATAGRGLLAPQDARLLLLPVASLTGGWFWVTSPLLLALFRREAKTCCPMNLPDKVPTCAGETVLLADPAAAYATQDAKYVCLYDEVLCVDKDSTSASAWASYFAEQLFSADPDWGKVFLTRFAIVSDEVMDYFSKFATEDQARVKLDENRVAQGTALWREECLPMETVLFGVVGAEGRKSSLFPEAKDVLAKIPAKCTLQIGGKASTGKGMVDCILVSPQQ